MLDGLVTLSGGAAGSRALHAGDYAYLPPDSKIQCAAAVHSFSFVEPENHKLSCNEVSHYCGRQDVAGLALLPEQPAAQMTLIADSP